MLDAFKSVVVRFVKKWRTDGQTFGYSVLSIGEKTHGYLVEIPRKFTKTHDTNFDYSRKQDDSILVFDCTIGL